MKSATMWIYQALLCILLSVDMDCKKQTLQRYQKTENTRLLCTDCSESPRVKALSLDDCARKCIKSKKSCRAFYFDQFNRKCHLLPFDRFSEGAQKERKPNYDLYEKKDYVKECIIGAGVNYKGRRSFTKTGITCQAWNMSVPHEHNFKPARHKRFDLRQNFCRNPDNDPSGPWCFTELTETRHQECGLPQCSDVECMRCNGETYRGPMDHTESGKACQRWDSQKPHKHTYQPHRHVDKGLDDNYCRNPNNDVRPWCYTMERNTPWEYCNISVCDSDEDVAVDTTTSCFRGHGEGYRGTVNVTSAGVTCQRWDSLFPHNHSYTPHNYKCKDLRENFCRNPDGSEIPWCFTTDPKIRKAFCTNIPRCESEISDSTAKMAQTDGHVPGAPSDPRKQCPPLSKNEQIKANQLLQMAASQRDIRSAAASTSLELNLCRNPDRDKHGPWCFTSNSSIPWDYCRLERCGRPKPSCFIHKATRIVGGMQVQRAEDGSWVVSIQKRNKHWCGGSLIREEWVLTDQQCFSTCVPDLSEYTVQVGLLHLNGSASAQGTGDEGSLKMVGLPIVSNKKCSQSHKGILPMTENKICAGGKRDQGVCERDYGGPLVCQEREGKVIVGVSINGRGCAVARRPAVFVNVAFYSEWIRKVFKYYSDMETSF
ncbi:Hepatocyte growth factor Hepatopoietin-A [Triplophysa tibetana]|uniref:Hepatocyte growth factor Hepatopoietin-A n=1 Tax=Triplophysa tibetana TaxID=1572043 RepID=A0A5A9PIQ7_9TELE|nr:Hepatocyte growth factor Hepatopoietin-A [Triplophysa tibetana]